MVLRLNWVHLLCLITFYLTSICYQGSNRFFLWVSIETFKWLKYISCIYWFSTGAIPHFRFMSLNHHFHQIIWHWIEANRCPLTEALTCPCQSLQALLIVNLPMSVITGFADKQMLIRGHVRLWRMLVESVGDQSLWS